MHGEEFGGPAVGSRWAWCGPHRRHSNYAAGSPLAAILLGPAFARQVPVAGDLDAAFTDQRYTAVAEVVR